jgi:GxxExxY protein
MSADLMNHRDTEITEEGKDQLSREVIGAAIDVHRALGPGLLESAYEECLCHELSLRRIAFRRQVAQPVEYKGIKLDCGYRIDLLVNERLVVEVKAVDALHPIHTAQLLTYLKLSGHRVGLLLNFHSVVLKDGIKRLVI